ncbi:MAG: hypothetical protein HPY50_10490 [Firmicutes bacterium]|nr:hypothetical protein [Bacillota bacterium]
MASKLMSLEQAAALVQDGQMLALGGNSLHRSPASLCREIARQGRSGLKLVSAAGGYNIDVLCAAEAVNEVYFGFIGFENEYGLCQGFRQGVQEGKIRAVEGS